MDCIDSRDEHKRAKMSRQYLTPNDVANTLNCSVWTVWRMIHRGDIPACYITPLGTPGAKGCRYRIDPAAINALRASSNNAEYVAAMEHLKSKGIL